jgi:hypothetical protein
MSGVLVLVATAAKKEAMAPRRASVSRMHSLRDSAVHQGVMKSVMSSFCGGPSNLEIALTDTTRGARNDLT